MHSIDKAFPISFEFFPPKTEEGRHHLKNAVSLLTTASPQYFSVTFGAGGSTRQGTLETVSQLQQTSNISVAPHLSCISSSEEETRTMLATYKRMQVKRIVALRGDLPSGAGQAGHFHYASELVSFIRKETGSFFHIEVAAYPEIHPQAKSAKDDVLNLKRKFDAGADAAITQYFFNPDAYFYYLEECAKLNIHMPIVPGIMPIVNYTQLARFSEMCGAEIPRWIAKRMQSYGDDLESIKSFGMEVTHHLCDQLIKGGAPGLHFYTLNKAEPSLTLVEMLRALPLDMLKRTEDEAVNMLVQSNA